MGMRARGAVHRILASFEELFQSYNIYKSVVIVRPGRVNAYYRQLVQRDYPVATMSTLDRFVLGSARVLLTDDIDARQLLPAMRGVEHVLDQVSVVVLFDARCDKRRFMRKTPHFFI